jgi:hypothetical protein
MVAGIVNIRRDVDVSAQILATLATRKNLNATKILGQILSLSVSSHFIGNSIVR